MLQTAFGPSQSSFRPTAISVSVAKDKRKTGGKCIVSAITFPLDFEVRADILTARDQASISAQAAALVLVNLNPSIEKKALKEKIKQIPLIGKQIKEFCGAHTLRDWLKAVGFGESKKGRPAKDRPPFLPPKSLELSLNQTRKLYTPLAREIEGYLARLKEVIIAIAVTLAVETSFSEEEIYAHELIQNLLGPVSININQTEMKWEWAKAWMRSTIEQVREK